MRAYVLLRVKPKDTMKVMSDLKDIKAIIQANAIHGPHDCLIEIQADTLDSINSTVLDIRAMKGVVDTTTCLVVQSWRRTK